MAAINQNKCLLPNMMCKNSYKPQLNFLNLAVYLEVKLLSVSLNQFVSSLWLNKHNNKFKLGINIHLAHQKNFKINNRPIINNKSKIKLIRSCIDSGVT